MNSATRLADFDVPALWEALDARRRERNLSWHRVMNEINSASPGMPPIRPMSASTVQNIRRRRALTCQHAVALLRWLDRSPESFLSGGEQVGRPIPVTGPNRKPRWDMRALAEAIDAERRDRGLTWAGVAQELGCNTGQVSSLRARRYGIGMNLAMKITQWLGRPAADFIIAANW